MLSRLRPRLEGWLNRRWYGDTPPEWPLRLLACIQSILVRLNRRRARKAWRAPVPVVVIGNLTVGGSGKTPLLIHLVRILTERGLKVGVVSRGYGRSSSSTRLVGPDDDWREVGDEPLLIYEQSACPVAVGRRRPEACRLLLSRYDLDLILSDDGLQHYPMHRDREILVIDGERGFGNRALFPAGPLREPIWRAREVHWCVWNGSLPAGEQGLVMRRQVRHAVNIITGEKRPLDSFAPGPVHAVAGVGAPQRFFDSLEQYGIRLIPHAPGDHGQWQGEEVGEEIVLMTEKDAVKIKGRARKNWWQVPLELNLDSAEALISDLCSLSSGDGSE